MSEMPEKSESYLDEFDREQARRDFCRSRWPKWARKVRFDRVAQVLNAPIVLLILTSIIIQAITTHYTNRQSQLEQEHLNAVVRQKIAEELMQRIHNALESYYKYERSNEQGLKWLNGESGASVHPEFTRRTLASISQQFGPLIGSEQKREAIDRAIAGASNSDSGNFQKKLLNLHALLSEFVPH